MKTILFGSILFLFISLFYPSSDQAHYYWEGDNRHSYIIDTSLLLVEFQAKHIEESSLLASYPEAETYRIKDDSTVQLIVRPSAEFLSKMSIHQNFFQYPAIQVKGTNGISFITDEISIMFNGRKNESELKEFAEKLDLMYLLETSYGAHIFRAHDRSKTGIIANFIMENEEVIWSNPNFVHLISLHNDPLYSDQYYLHNTGQGGGTHNIDINAPEAWDITLGCNDIRVAVVDDGVENHPDFDGRVLPGITAGVNNSLGLPINHTSKGHGINCAGIIAATHNNTIGIKGIAPHSRLVPINIFPHAPSPANDYGAATNAEIATVINWAWNPNGGNAHILSNSWAGGNPVSDITTAITNARTQGRGNLGAIVIFASGNTSGGVAYPGYVDGVITVGAINRNGNIWNYSGRGPSMDLVAPSGGGNGNGDVRTTDRVGANGSSTGDFTNTFGGTSAAAPQVAGVAALMLSVNPSLTEQQVRTILQNTATDMGPTGFDNTYGYGRVDAGAAVKASLPIAGPDLLCTTNTNYNIPNLPAGSMVTWQVSPSPLFASPSSGTGATATLRAASSSVSGMGTLTFTIVRGCGVTVLRKNIWVGKPDLTKTINGIIAGTTPVTAGNLYNLSASSQSPNTTFNYNNYMGSGNMNIDLYNPNSPSTQMYVYSTSTSGSRHVRVTATNACGSYSQDFVFYLSNYFTIFPNPANDLLTVEFGAIDNPETLPQHIYIYSEFLAKPIKSISVKNIVENKMFKNGNKIEIQVDDLPRGVYYMHLVRTNGETQKRQIILR